jgi:DNA-binding winged helix-turn-helix (wHTH) protein
MLIEFSPFVLDDGRHQLLNGGVEVRLSLKGYELLKLLLESRPRVVKRTEIYDRLWPATFVTDATLRGVVAEVRAALGGTEGAARFVRTVQRVGYAFSGEATERKGEMPVAPVSVSCWFALGTREFPLNDGENVIGRQENAVVRIDDGTVSRRHARLVIGADGATLEDLASRNGTYVGGVRITGPVAVKDGDTVRFGSVSVAFRSLATPASTVPMTTGPRSLVPGP